MVGLDTADFDKLWDILYNEIHLGIKPDMEGRDFCRNIRQYQPKMFSKIHAEVMGEFDGDGDVAYGHQPGDDLIDG